MSKFFKKESQFKGLKNLFKETVPFAENLISKTTGKSLGASFEKALNESVAAGNYSDDIAKLLITHFKGLNSKAQLNLLEQLGGQEIKSLKDLSLALNQIKTNPDKIIKKLPGIFNEEALKGKVFKPLSEGIINKTNKLVDNLDLKDIAGSIPSSKITTASGKDTFELTFEKFSKSGFKQNLNKEIQTKIDDLENLVSGMQPNSPNYNSYKARINDLKALQKDDVQITKAANQLLDGLDSKLTTLSSTSNKMNKKLLGLRNLRRGRNALLLGGGALVSWWALDKANLFAEGKPDAGTPVDIIPNKNVNQSIKTPETYNLKMPKGDYDTFKFPEYKAIDYKGGVMANKIYFKKTAQNQPLPQKVGDILTPEEIKLLLKMPSNEALKKDIVYFKKQAINNNLQGNDLVNYIIKNINTKYFNILKTIYSNPKYQNLLNNKITTAATYNDLFDDNAKQMMGNIGLSKLNEGLGMSPLSTSNFNQHVSQFSMPRFEDWLANQPERNQVYKSDSEGNVSVSIDSDMQQTLSKRYFDEFLQGLLSSLGQGETFLLSDVMSEINKRMGGNYISGEDLKNRATNLGISLK